MASAHGEFCRFAAQAMADIAEAGQWKAVIAGPGSRRLL